jgi:hypothetical protein
MNKEIIKEEIKWLLEAINEQYEAITHHNERVPQIEFDILMENLRKFYEDLQLLKRLDDPHYSIDRKVPSKVAPSVPSAGFREMKPPKPPVPPAEPPSSPAVQPQPQYQPQAQTQPQSKPAATFPARNENQSFTKKQSKPEEIDLFAAAEPAMNTRLKEARERTFSPKIPSDRIDNLKTAIIINDKFMFINELFEGNLREYNETIETLNGFKTLNQAADYLDLMRKKNFWNTGSVAFKKLKELVERRF